MSIADLKKNIVEAKKLLVSLKGLEEKLSYTPNNKKAFMVSAYNSILARLKLINKAIPDIVKDVSAVKKLNSDSPSIVSQRKEVSNFRYSSDSGQQKMISLNKGDREKFLKELSISESHLKKVNTQAGYSNEIRPNVIAKLSSSIFGGIAEKIANGVPDLKQDLKESNSRFLVSTYVAIALFSSLSVFVLSSLLLVLFFISGSPALNYAWLPPLLLFVSMVGFYMYPASRKSSINKEISTELPFATIYMSAIAGSNIEPTKIFKIIADSPEYKYVGAEMRKIINQIEIYGYDLVNALKNVAKNTINKKLAELLNGMATNIATGSSLQNYLEKKSQNLLEDYKMERTKYNDVASTFMDVYISVLITAPLILVMLIVIMSLTNLKFGSLSTDSMLTFSIVGVAIINVIFLIFLQIKQPKV
jgi:pilus assembly protein TadC